MAIGDQPIASSSLDATFTRTEDGMLTTTWTGPISGITLPVFVIAPRDYSPTDGKTYAVIELLHGYPGEADGTTQGAHVQEALDNAIDAGIIPPTIIVVPSLSVDEEAHDCADIEDRPAVYTWSAHEIPAFIRHNLPQHLRQARRVDARRFLRGCLLRGVDGDAHAPDLRRSGLPLRL